MSALAKAAKQAAKENDHLHVMRRSGAGWACQVEVEGEQCPHKTDKHGKTILPPTRGHLRLAEG